MFKESSNVKDQKGVQIPEYLTKLAKDSVNIIASNNHGYVITPQKILRCYRLTDFEVRLLLDLLSAMGGTGYAFYSHKALAFKQGKKSVSSVKKTLNSLRNKGFIHWKVGGADLGTNHYYLNSLYHNAFLILSEATHYFIEEIKNIYRGVIKYEDLYSAILEFVEKPQSQLYRDNDVYGQFIIHLMRNYKERDSFMFYYLFFCRLFKQLYFNANFYVEIKTQIKFHETFREFFYKHIKMEDELECTIELYDLSDDDFKKFAPDLYIRQDDELIEVQFASEAQKSWGQGVQDLSLKVALYVDRLSDEQVRTELKKRNIPYDINDILEVEGEEDQFTVLGPPRGMLENAIVHEAIMKTL